MVTFGIDPHKRTHTVAAVDGLGRQLGQMTVTKTTSEANLALLRWAERFGPDRQWAVEDCRRWSRRLEGDLLRAGERVRRVPPKLTAHARDVDRSYGKSDPIDAVAVARAALRHPDLPVARLDGPTRRLRLLVDHREDLVNERTRGINRLREHLHELDAEWDPPKQALRRLCQLDAIITRLAAIEAAGVDSIEGVVARIAGEIAAQVRQLTVAETALEREISTLVAPLAENLLQVVGVGALTAAKILGEVADITRFRDANAFARHTGTAPVPASSGGTQRHRLARTGNRQLNAALHRIALTQTRCHPPARAYRQKRHANGNSPTEATRALKRRLSDVIYRALHADAHLLDTPLPQAA